MKHSALLLLVVLLGPVPIADADGTLDLSCGNGGLVTRDFPKSPPC